MQPRPREALFALSEAPPGAEETKVLEHVFELTADQQDDLVAAEAILWRLSAASPFADLQRTVTELRRTLDEPPTSIAAGFEYAAEVRRRVRHWLNDIRSFDDRTSRWVSEVFGKDHAAYIAFKEGLSREYDGNAGYRISAGIRNSSVHAVDVVNVQMLHLTRGDGPAMLTPEIGIHGPTLALEVPEMKAEVREELAAAEGVINLTRLLDAAHASCRYVYGLLVDALWDEIEPERSFVQSLHDAALEAGGRVAVIVNRETYDPQSGHFDHRYNPQHLVENLEQVRATTMDPLGEDVGGLIAIDDLLEPPFTRPDMSGEGVS